MLNAVDILSVCYKIPSLSSIADDIYIVMHKNEFHNTNPTENESWQQEEIAKMERWKISAQKLINIAKKDPEKLIPIWDRLQKKINEASYHWITQKKIGTYQTMYDGDVRDFPEYETIKHKKSLGLTFPDMSLIFRNKL